MMRRAALTLVVAGVCWAAESPADEAVARARKMSAADAVKLERAVAEKPEREKERAALIAYWSFAMADPASAEKAKTDRNRHILWMIEHHPESGYFDIDSLGIPVVKPGEDTRMLSTARYWYIPTKGPTADKAAFEKGHALWLAHTQKRDIRREVIHNAARWIENEDPSAAVSLYLRLGEGRQAGTLLGRAALGDHDGPENSENARAALARIDASPDPELVWWAARSFAYEAGNQYADGKIDWDFTPISRRLVDRLRRMDPANLDVEVLPVTLPERGKRPPTALAIGGSVIQERIVPGSQVQPFYPQAARAAGIQGTVRFNVLIGLSGEVKKVALVSGPQALVQAAAEALVQWRYKPTLLNGAPCYVITVADLNFLLQ